MNSSPRDRSDFTDQPGPLPPDHEAYTDRPRRRPPDAREGEGRGDLPKLGSLAQAARGKQLNQARIILIVIGVLTIGVNALFMAMARENVKKEIEKEIEKQGGRGRLVIDEAKVKQAEDEGVRILLLANGVGLALGVLFVIFGLIVKAFPVPVTVLSLVIYIVANIGFGVLDPPNLARGVIIKIVIVVALVKAIQAALAYEKERREWAEVREGTL